MTRRRVQKVFSDMPSLTKQAFKDDCNLNLIVRRFTQTGQVPVAHQRPLHFGPEEELDFHQAQLALARARSTFEILRPELQEKYESIEGIIEAVNDPARASQLHADGILDAFGIPYTPEAEKPATEEPTGIQPDLLPADSAPEGDGDAVPSEASKDA